MACGFAENLQVSINLKGFYKTASKHILSGMIQICSLRGSNDAQGCVFRQF